MWSSIFSHFTFWPLPPSVPGVPGTPAGPGGPWEKKLIMIKNPFFTITTDINRKKKNLQLCRPLQDRPKTRSTVNIWSKERKF